MAAHVAWMPGLPARRFVQELSRSGLRINKMIRDTAVRWSQRGTSAVLEQLCRNVDTGAVLLGSPPAVTLADVVIHQLDICRPLGRLRPIPSDAFVAVADLQVRVRWQSTIVVGGSARRRIRGIRLVAHDVDWSHGSGEEVRGSGEALLLMLTGRAVDDDELTGPGSGRLRDGR